MRFFIPELGTRLTLTKSWTFRLFYEHRNQKFGEKLGVPAPAVQRYGWWRTSEDFTDVKIPKDTVLKVDRIYVRKGASAFSSVSFLWKGKGRFWAKLDDVNQIHYKIEEGS